MTGSVVVGSVTEVPGVVSDSDDVVPGSVVSGSVVVVTTGAVVSGSVVVTTGAVVSGSVVVTAGAVVSGSVVVTTGAVVSGSVVVAAGAVVSGSVVVAAGAVVSGSVVVVTAGSVVSGSVVVITEGDYLAAENFTGTGVLFTLIFTVSENAEATVYPITFSKPDFLDKDMNTVTVSCTDGAVTLESGTEPDVLRGDTDCNGEVSIEDVQLALQAYTMRVSGKDTGLTDKQLKAADVNENGDLSVDDVQNILIYYVNNTVAGKKLTWEELLGDQPQPRPDVLKARAS